MKNLCKGIGTFFGVSAVLALVLFLSCKLTTNYPAYAKNDPPAKPSTQDVSDLDLEKKAVADTIVNFYKAVSKNKCEAAKQLRENYDCRSLHKAVVAEYKVKDVFKKYAIAYVSIDIYETKSDKNNWKGHCLLKRDGNRWILMATPYWVSLHSSDLPIAYGKDEYQRYLLFLKQKKNIHLQRNVVSTFSPTATQSKEKKELDFWEETLEPSTAPLKTSQTYGSKNILGACWSPTHLYGSPDEDRMVFRPFDTPDKAKPPSRLRPTPAGELPELPTNLQKSIRRVNLPPGSPKYIALTFDLCERQNERTGYDGHIVNYLRKNKIKATFYAGGKWMRSHPEKTKQLMADPLFEIGNHAWTHGNFGVIDETIMREQVLWTQAQYELLWDELEKDSCASSFGVAEMKKIPRVPLTFRFPYGTCKPVAFSILAENGLPAIQWDVVSGDPAPKQYAKPMAQGILSHTKPGSIIICHANGRGHHTQEALHLFIPKLLEREYKFVTVSELLKLGTPEAHDSCYELSPGDNERYNRIFGPGMK